MKADVLNKELYVAVTARIPQRIGNELPPVPTAQIDELQLQYFTFAITSGFSELEAHFDNRHDVIIGKQ